MFTPKLDELRREGYNNKRLHRNLILSEIKMIFSLHKNIFLQYLEALNYLE